MSEPSPERPGSQPEPSRRDFLRLAGGAAVGAGFVLGGCSSSSKASGASSKAAGAAPKTAGASSTTTGAARNTLVPKLQSRSGGTTVNGIQHFRSRPDLRPPEIIIHTRADHVIPGHVFTECHFGGVQQGPVILTETGRLVGFMPLTPKPTSTHRAFNVRVQTYQGKPVMTWFQGAVVSGHGQGYYEIYDENYRQVAQVHAGNGYQGDLHEFLLTDQGTALFTAYGTAVGRLPSGRRGKYFYGIVQEIDVATGKVLFQWRSDQHVPLAASYHAEPRKPSNTWDYFHVNAITIDPTDNNLVISSRNTWACYKVDRKTGRVIWKLGGKHGDFRMGPGTHFAFQHDINLHPGGVMTMFDNEGGPPNEASQSRGLVLQIDEGNKTARLRTQFHHDPPVLSQALGSVQLLDQGHTFMGWGSSSYFTEYGPGGKVLFDGRFKDGVASYRAFKETWTGTPQTAPSLHASRQGPGATLYASWNFATEVAGWVALSGHSASQLDPVGVAKLAGFETEMSVPHARRYVAVEAIDGNGKVLARSKPVKL